MLAFVPVDSLVTAGHVPAPEVLAEARTDPPLSERAERPASLGWTLWGDAYL